MSIKFKIVSDLESIRRVNLFLDEHGIPLSVGVLGMDIYAHRLPVGMLRKLVLDYVDTFLDPYDYEPEEVEEIETTHSKLFLLDCVKEMKESFLEEITLRISREDD